MTRTRSARTNVRFPPRATPIESTQESKYRATMNSVLQPSSRCEMGAMDGSSSEVEDGVKCDALLKNRFVLLNSLAVLALVFPLISYNRLLTRLRSPAFRCGSSYKPGGMTNRFRRSTLSDVSSFFQFILPDSRQLMRRTLYRCTCSIRYILLIYDRW